MNNRINRQCRYNNNPYEIPLTSFTPYLDLPSSYPENPSNTITTKLHCTYTARVRSPMLFSRWMHDGIRILSGNSCGELAIWSKPEETIEIAFSAHDTSVQSFDFTRIGDLIISIDHGGVIKYWQNNLNFLHQMIGHTAAGRDISFAPTFEKFVSCGDDGYVSIWDLEACKNDRQMNAYGSEVKCVDWHPNRGLIISGSKDGHHPLILWDPRTTSPICTINSHKNAINDVAWNPHGGNLFASCSRDHLVKVFDIRQMKEYRCFIGHKNDAICVSWNPVNPKSIVSGAADGSIAFWNVYHDNSSAIIDDAHDGAIWALSWHPLGHFLVTSSNDCTNKVWSRNNVGERYMNFYESNSRLIFKKYQLMTNQNNPFCMINEENQEENNPFDFISEPFSSSKAVTSIEHKFNNPCPEKNVPHILNLVTDVATVEEEEQYLYNDSVSEPNIKTDPSN